MAICCYRMQYINHLPLTNKQVTISTVFFRVKRRVSIRFIDGTLHVLNPPYLVEIYLLVL